MNADHLFRFVFGPAALPLGIALLLYLLSTIRTGYFTSKTGNRIYRDRQPANFWTGIIIGILVFAVLAVSATTYFVFDKTILEYSGTHEDARVSRESGERSHASTFDSAAGKRHGLAPYAP